MRNCTAKRKLKLILTFDISQGERGIAQNCSPTFIQLVSTVCQIQLHIILMKDSSSLFFLLRRAENFCYIFPFVFLSFSVFVLGFHSLHLKIVDFNLLLLSIENFSHRKCLCLVYKFLICSKVCARLARGIAHDILMAWQNA